MDGILQEIPDFRTDRKSDACDDNDDGGHNRVLEQAQSFLLIHVSSVAYATNNGKTFLKLRRSRWFRQ